MDIAPTTTDTKPWFQSKGAVGAVVSVIALGAGMAGYQIMPDLQADIAKTWLDVVAMVGAVVALVGRLTASKKLI
jgi:hypothetical protein